MTDIILSVRLGIDDTKKNQKMIVKFSKWLNQKYLEHGTKFLENILEAAQIPFEGYMTSRINHSEYNDPFMNLRHPKAGKNGEWFLDEIKIKNKEVVWIKLENQWIKGKVVSNKKNSSIVIEPEDVVIPMTKGLFLER